MTAARYDLSIDQGQTFELSLTYKKSSGEPHDLTNCDVEMQIRQSPGATVVLDLTQIPSGITITPLDGRITLYIPDTTTEALTPQRYRYDLILVLADGRKQRLLEGKCVVNAGITQDAP